MGSPNHVYEQVIAQFRQVIHEAEPPWSGTHAYLNLDHPLTACRFEHQDDAPTTRLAALRHALWLLEQAEHHVADDSPCLINNILGIVEGILWAHGVGCIPGIKLCELTAQRHLAEQWRRD